MVVDVLPIALESTIISPQNFKTAKHVEIIVKENGVVPTTT